ncbi:MAG: type VII secretion protein EccB [Micromonosporaceae bacterium]
MAAAIDQVHSHQFARQRVVAALAVRDPDGSPSRRLGSALLAGVMLAALALAGTAGYGIIRPSDDSWRDGAVVIVERETGARFVFRDGLLHPVLNYSSALLLLGSSRTALVARAALSDVPRGATLGIPGAPDQLPAAADLLTGAWQLCSRPTDGAGAESVLFVGATPARPAGDIAGRGLLVVDAAGDPHLIWNDHRYAIRDATVVLTALGWTSQRSTPVADAVLNAIPAGPDLARVAVPGRGGPSTVPGGRVGQVFVVQNQSGARQYAVALADGLASITQVQADLLLADPANVGSDAGPDAAPTPLSPAAYAALGPVRPLIPAGDAAAPATTPPLAAVGTGEGVCASFTADGSPGRVRLGAAPRPAGAIRTGCACADWVAVGPGHGALVEALAGPSAPTGTLLVVSDLGIAYPLPSADAQARLGYSGVRPQRLPAALTALLPAGPALDPALAGRPAAP